MRHSLSLPYLPFDPGITSALQTSHLLRQVIDHFLECQLATDFGLVSRAMRFNHVLDALLETGQLTSGYHLHSTIRPPEAGLFITTHLDERTTTIRFASEQMYYIALVYSTRLSFFNSFAISNYNQTSRNNFFLVSKKVPYLGTFSYLFIMRIISKRTLQK
jgi:hypothetical protein